MNRETLNDEIAGALAALPDEWITMLIDASMTAWLDLARHPRGEELDRMLEIGRKVGTRSRKPHMVLRKVIERAGEIYDYVPGPQVIAAARLSPKRAAS